MNARRLLGAHLPTPFPERRETVEGECLGCLTQFAIDVRLPLPAVCPDCGADVLARADFRGRSASAPTAVQRATDRESVTMTLRFIVSRILRELIELAEHDGDAELVDALDVAMPASSNGRCE